MENEKNSKPKDKVCFIIGIALLVVWVLACVLFGGKVEKAEAAETSDGVYYPNLFTDVDLSTYEESVRNICDTFPCLVVTKGVNNNTYTYYFLKESSSKELKWASFWGQCTLFNGSAWVAVTDGVCTNASVSSADTIQINMNYSGGSSDKVLVGTNFSFDFSESSNQSNYEAIYAELSSKTNNLVHPNNYVETVYSPEAPYVSFKSLIVDNRLNKGIDASVNDASHLYSEYFMPSYWQFIYDMNNISDLDVSYKLNLKFEIEIPTLDYIERLYDAYGYNMDSARVVLRRNNELISYWNKDIKADARTVIVEYSMDVSPSVYGNISYQFSFAEWEYLIRASSEELNAELSAYDAGKRATLLSFMHVKKITSEVITKRASSAVYGGYTSNVFERGVYDTCVDVYTKVDKNFVTDDLLDDMISSDVKVAEREYQKELEERIEKLEKELENATGSLGVYDDMYEGQNLWEIVKSAGTGLLSLLTTLTFIPRALGSIFVFFPKEMQDIMGYVVILSIFFIIWRLFKGK